MYEVKICCYLPFKLHPICGTFVTILTYLDIFAYLVGQTGGKMDPIRITSVVAKRFNYIAKQIPLQKTIIAVDTNKQNLSITTSRCQHRAKQSRQHDNTILVFRQSGGKRTMSLGKMDSLFSKTLLHETKENRRLQLEKCLQLLTGQTTNNSK